MNPIIIVYMIYIYIVHKMVLNIYMNDEIMKSDEFLGKRIKELRESKNMSMRDVSKALGIPYTTYVNYEKGFREPNSEFLIAIANYYGVSVDYIIGRSVVIKMNVSEKLRDNVNVIKIAGRDGSYLERKLTDDQLDLLKKMIEQMPESEDL